MLKEPPIVVANPVHELSRSQEFKSTEMWPYVELPMPPEITIDSSKFMKEKMPSPKPKIVVAKPMEEGAMEEQPVKEELQQVRIF
jgi:hypothetical protein